MQVMILYPDIMIYNDHRVLGPLIDSLKSSSFQMDTKLAMIKQFLPKIKFQHIDMLVNNFQHIVQTSNEMDGIFVCNVNPFLVSVTILFICEFIKQGFPLAKLRIEQFEAGLIHSMITLLNNVYDHEKIRLLLQQTDSENYNTLALMAKMNMY